MTIPRPDVPKEVDAQPSDEVPFPSSLEVPNYPPNAIGSEYVLVEVEVGDTGSVRSAKSIGESTGFDSAALLAARAWTFRAGSRKGRPFPAFVYIVFAFRQPV